MKRIALCGFICVLALLALINGRSAHTRPAFIQDTRLDDLKREAVSEVDKLRTFTQQMVDQVFSFSELGFHEYETSKYLTGILGKNGFKVERGVAGMPTAWMASWSSGGSGKPVIAFITDI